MQIILLFCWTRLINCYSYELKAKGSFKVSELQRNQTKTLLSALSAPHEEFPLQDPRYNLFHCLPLFQKYKSLLILNPRLPPSVLTCFSSPLSSYLFQFPSRENQNKLIDQAFMYLRCSLLGVSPSSGALSCSSLFLDVFLQLSPCNHSGSETNPDAQHSSGFTPEGLPQCHPMCGTFSLLLGLVCRTQASRA